MQFFAFHAKIEFSRSAERSLLMPKEINALKVSLKGTSWQMKILIFEKHRKK